MTAHKTGASGSDAGSRSGGPESTRVLTRPFRELGLGDIASVGGKNASLGEMIGALAPLGIAVPPGFATTAEAFWAHQGTNGLSDRIRGAPRERQRRAGRPPASGAEDPRRHLLRAPSGRDQGVDSGRVPRVV